MKIRRDIIILSAAVLASCSGGSEIPGPPGGGSESEETAVVLEYRPAPGQFINENMSGTTRQQAIQWAQDRLDKGLYVSLGAFGGYIVVRMPESVQNKSGYDFTVAGNAISTSSEPGIVWVSHDVNGNGLADDPWYELGGSDSGQTSRGVTITYYRPADGKNVDWLKKNAWGNEESGYVKYLPQYHSQPYYPAWIGEDSYTLEGSFLEHRTEYVEGEWVNKPFGWGYADNIGSDAVKGANGDYKYNRFDISNAIDAAGNPVALTRIEFIKVQTAVLSIIDANITGEVSTEVSGFQAL